jgi:hypothetical protein
MSEILMTRWNKSSRKFTASSWSESRGVTSGCGTGWKKLLEDLHDDLVKIDPDYKLSQFKEKFGTLRFYATARRTVTARRFSKGLARPSRTRRSSARNVGSPVVPQALGSRPCVSSAGRNRRWA